MGVKRTLVANVCNASRETVKRWCKRGRDGLEKKLTEPQLFYIEIIFMVITIFALGLVLHISQVPMLFAPLQTVSTDIQPVAYRTSMILVEDGGIYNGTEGISSDWDEHPTNYTNISRIGLAMSTRELGWPSSSEDIFRTIFQ